MFCVLCSLAQSFFLPNGIVFRRRAAAAATRSGFHLLTLLLPACLPARERERQAGRQAESHPHFPNLSCCLRFQSGVLTPKTTRDDNKTCCFSKSTTHIEIKKTRLSVKIQAYLHVYPASSSVNYAKITVYGEYLRLAAPVISIFS